MSLPLDVPLLLTRTWEAYAQEERSPQSRTAARAQDHLIDSIDNLVECDDPALIRKAVVLEKLNGMSGRFAAAAEGTSLDFARVDDGPCVEMEREIASLVVRTWADHKHFTG